LQGKIIPHTKTQSTQKLLFLCKDRRACYAVPRRTEKDGSRQSAGYALTSYAGPRRTENGGQRTEDRRQEIGKGKEKRLPDGIRSQIS